MTMIIIVSDHYYLQEALTTIPLFKNMDILTVSNGSLKNIEADSSLVIIDKDVKLDKKFKHVIALHSKNKCLEKPFRIFQLISLINQHLYELEYVSYKHFDFNHKRRELRNKFGNSIFLTEKESSLLEYLLKNNSSVLKSSALSDLWQYKEDI